MRKMVLLIAVFLMGCSTTRPAAPMAAKPATPQAPVGPEYRAKPLVLVFRLTTLRPVEMLDRRGLLPVGNERVQVAKSDRCDFLQVRNSLRENPDAQEVIIPQLRLRQDAAALIQRNRYTRLETQMFDDQPGLYVLEASDITKDAATVRLELRSEWEVEARLSVGGWRTCLIDSPEGFAAVVVLLHLLEIEEP